jgi:hypothetical protein
MTSPLLISEQNVVFLKNNGTKELLKFCENGDIFVNGKLVENDKEIVDGLREFLKGQQTFNKMEKQTAVDWIEDKIQSNMTFIEILGLIRQAKKIEKQQIKNAHTHNRCINNQTYDCTIEAFYNAEQYYNETFGK